MEYSAIGVLSVDWQQHVKAVRAARTYARRGNAQAIRDAARFQRAKRPNGKKTSAWELTEVWDQETWHFAPNA